MSKPRRDPLNSVTVLCSINSYLRTLVFECWTCPDTLLVPFITLLDQGVVAALREQDWLVWREGDAAIRYFCDACQVNDESKP